MLVGAGPPCWPFIDATTASCSALGMLLASRSTCRRAGRIARRAARAQSTIARDPAPEPRRTGMLTAMGTLKIEGAIDLHCHYGPDMVGVFPTTHAVTAVEAAREAAACGQAALVL